MKFEIRYTSGDVPVLEGVYISKGGCFGHTFIDIGGLEQLLSLMEVTRRELTLVPPYRYGKKYPYPTIGIDDTYFLPEEET